MSENLKWGCQGGREFTSHAGDRFSIRPRSLKQVVKAPLPSFRQQVRARVSRVLEDGQYIRMASVTMSFAR